VAVCFGAPRTKDLAFPPAAEEIRAAGIVAAYDNFDVIERELCAPSYGISGSR
jgi:hypothetical protein